MSDKSKTVLLVSGKPGWSNVGGILVQEMLAALEARQVTLMELKPDTVGCPPSGHDPGRLSVLSPHEHARRGGQNGKLGSACCFYDRQTRYRRAAKAAARNVSIRMESERPARLWTVLNSTAAIDVCWLIRKTIDMPLFLQLWDDPLHLLRQRRLDRLSIQQTLGRFNTLLASAQRVAVISEQMKMEYSDRTNAEFYVIQHGLDPVEMGSEKTSNPHRFVIGLSGSMYASSAWRSFQKALEELDWKISGREIEMLVLGSSIEFRSQSPANSTFLGWRSQNEVLERLSHCDLLYLPQSFAASDEPLSRLSFPTKLSTYVATGRPVFLHAPRYGSLNDFAIRHDFGLLCNSLEPSSIAQLLRDLGDGEISSRLAESSRRIARTVLSRRQFQEAVRAFLQ